MFDLSLPFSMKREDRIWQDSFVVLSFFLHPLAFLLSRAICCCAHSCVSGVLCFLSLCLFRV
jgi:hypothetical protein